MSLTIPVKKFTRFLCDAKRSTYAAQDKRARVDPVLRGSYQLEFLEGALYYRDIYFGGDYFTGLETVYFKETPVWGMSYAGGLNEGLQADETPGIYTFLTEALREVPLDAPFRGPAIYNQANFQYTNRIIGALSRFSGVETINFRDLPVYQLHYSGGLLKT